MSKEKCNGPSIRKTPIVSMGAGIRKRSLDTTKKRKKPIVTMGSGLRK